VNPLLKVIFQFSESNNKGVEDTIMISRLFPFLESRLSLQFKRYCSTQPKEHTIPESAKLSIPSLLSHFKSEVKPWMERKEHPPISLFTEFAYTLLHQPFSWDYKISFLHSTLSFVREETNVDGVEIYFEPLTSRLAFLLSQLPKNELLGTHWLYTFLTTTENYRPRSSRSFTSLVVAFGKMRNVKMIDKMQKDIFILEVPIDVEFYMGLLKGS